MARRQVGQLYTAGGEHAIRADEQGVGPLSHEGCKSRIDLAAGAGVEDLDLQSPWRGRQARYLSTRSRQWG